MSVGDIYRCSVIYTASDADGEVANVIDYLQDEVAVVKTEPEYCNELAAELRNTLQTELLPLIPSAWTLDRVDVFNVDQPQFSGNAASGDPGTDVAEPIPLRSATVVSKKTGLRGRSYNGRMYLPACGENKQNGGKLETTYQANVQSAVDELINFVLTNLNQYEMVVYSTTLALGTRVTTLDVRTDLGSIRGRQEVRG